MNAPILPTLSVSVIPLTTSYSMNFCLAALHRQIVDEPIEIIVPYNDRIDGLEEVKKKYPGVKWIHVPDKQTYAELRAAGVAAATGNLVAITEDHCRPDRDWCAQIIKAHAEDHPAIGGAVEKSGVDSALNWAVYFADYLRYALPFTESPIPTLTDLNVSYKRSDLQIIQEVWAQEFHEPVVHSMLTKDGRPLWIVPQIIVRQRRTYTLKEAVRERYAFGRLFGSTRVAGVGMGRRLVMAITALIVPILLVFRVTMHILRKRRWIFQFMLSFPALILISLAWGYGEFLGYITGRPDRSQAVGQ